MKDFQISMFTTNMIAASIATAPKKSAAKQREAAPRAKAHQQNDAAAWAPAAADNRANRESAPRKRGRAPNNGYDEDRPRSCKRGRTQLDPPEPPPERAVMNEAPTQFLDLFVWGSGNYRTQSKERT